MPDIPDHLFARTVNLGFNVAQALDIPYFQFLRSILGNPNSYDGEALETELQAFEPFFSVETAQRLLRLSVSVPFLNRYIREPSGPMPYDGSYAGQFPRERWFFINGICTDRRMAMLNADLLCRTFCRPLTILYNATDGIWFDLAESARGKAMETVTESAKANVDTFVGALCDPNIDRVVVIAHSQGTIVAAVLLKALQEALQGKPGVRSGPGAQRVSLERRIARKLMGTAPYVAPRAPTAARRAKRQLSPRDVGKLELYCFANCATSMEPFVAIGASPHHAPWIESYGNEHDLVAKLGLLAPPHGMGSARIAGDRYRRNGAWGHLLNAHYLNPMLNDLDDATSDGEKLVPFDSNLRSVPRLFEYARGSSPGAYP